MDDIFLSSMNYYSNHPALTLILCLVAHSGAHPLVPLVLNPVHRDPARRSVFYSFGSMAFYRDNHCRDNLSLSSPRYNMPDSYMQTLANFTRDPARSREYCLGLAAYEHAVLFCIEMLAAYNKRQRGLTISYASEDNNITYSSPDGDGRSCRQCSSLHCASGQWTITCQAAQY